MMQKWQSSLDYTRHDTCHFESILCYVKMGSNISRTSFKLSVKEFLGDFLF